MDVPTAPHPSQQDQLFTRDIPGAYEPLDQLSVQCNAFRPECINNDKMSHDMF